MISSVRLSALCENALTDPVHASSLEGRPIRSSCGARSQKCQGVEDPRASRGTAFSHSLAAKPT